MAVWRSVILMAALAAGATGATAQTGFTRDYRLDLQHCAEPLLHAYLDAVAAIPGVIESRPATCGAGACTMQVIATTPPNAMLRSLQNLPERLGRRARISVDGNAYTLLCLPGRPGDGDFDAYVTACGEGYDAAGDILFGFDEAHVRHEAWGFVDWIAGRIAALAPHRVEITGHTDSRGGAAYNRDLSHRRAEAVATLLLPSIRAAGAQLRVAGAGEAVPRAPNAHPDGTDYPEGRQRNRRVEVFLYTGGVDCGGPARRGPLDPADW